jgi:hypothetical protein
MAQSDSTTGTATASSLTFTELISRAKVLLNDEAGGTWDTEMIGTFLNEAIRDYSQHFPRYRSTTIAAATGTHTYDLPADFLYATRVEYPAGETPPQYLSLRARRNPDFWSGRYWYDVDDHFSSSSPAQLTISTSPSTGENIVVSYAAPHESMDDPAAPTGTSTVPGPHQPLLMSYILWQASNHLLLKEQQNPTSNSSLLMAQLSQNARRFEASYSTSLRQAIYAEEGRSSVLSWIPAAGDNLSRIY